MKQRQASRVKMGATSGRQVAPSFCYYLATFITITCFARLAIGQQVFPTPSSIYPASQLHQRQHQNSHVVRLHNTNSPNTNNNHYQPFRAHQLFSSSPNSNTINKNNLQQQQQNHHHHHHHNHQQQQQQLANLSNSPKFNICQVPDSQLNQTKCSPLLEPQFKQNAMADFQAQLSESSLELRNLISAYWLDFRHHSLDLIQLGQRQTRTRLLNEQLSKPARANMPDWMYANWVASSWRLFDTMIAHLNSSLSQHQQQQQSPAQAALAQPATATSAPNEISPNANVNPQTSEQIDLAQKSLDELNSELNSFVKRLHLMQAKYLLDQRLEPIAAAAGPSNQLDLECMSANLNSGALVDALLSELVGYSSLPPESQLEWSRGQATLLAEQAQLTQSIRQSLEFARTLLSSLTLAREMFNNLSQRTADWMPHASCHHALTRMSVCPQCAAQQQQHAPVPCENYCLNVLRGCMNDIYELNRFWADQVNSLSKFKSNMIQMNNIENVMSSLDESLVQFVMRLSQQSSPSAINRLHFPQQQQASSASSSSQNQTTTSTSTSSNSNSQQQQQQQQAAEPSIPLGIIGRQMLRICNLRSGSGNNIKQQSAKLHHLAAPFPAHFQARGSSAAAGPSELGRASASSASQSLFNKLDSFVHQLQPSRSFFATWPERVCRKLRQPAPAADQSAATGPPASQFAPARMLPMPMLKHQRSISSNANNNNQRNSTGQLNQVQLLEQQPTGACWNGIDFSGSYTKPLAQFGQPITSNHPEVPKSHSDPFNLMVLNFVARLKYIGAQLARKSIRSPQMSILHSLPPETLASLVNSLVPQAFVSESVSTGSSALPGFRQALRQASVGNYQHHHSSNNNNNAQHHHLNNQQWHPAARSIKQNATATLEILSAVGSELDAISNASPTSEDDAESGDNLTETPSNGQSASTTLGSKILSAVQLKHGDTNGDLNSNNNQQQQDELNNNYPATADSDSISIDDSDEFEDEEEEQEPDCKTGDCSDLLTRTTTSADSPSLSSQQTVSLNDDLNQGLTDIYDANSYNSGPLQPSTPQQYSPRYPATIDMMDPSLNNMVQVSGQTNSPEIYFSRPNGYINYPQQASPSSGSTIQFALIIVLFLSGSLAASMLVGLFLCSSFRNNRLFNQGGNVK